MRLVLTPVRMSRPLLANVSGDVLTLNDDVLDFTPLLAGETLPRDAIGSEWVAGDVTRDAAGLLTVPLILPHGSDAPPQTLFPVPIDATEWVVPLPPYEV